MDLSIWDIKDTLKVQVDLSIWKAVKATKSYDYGTFLTLEVVRNHFDE